MKTFSIELYLYFILIPQLTTEVKFSDEQLECSNCFLFEIFVRKALRESYKVVTLMTLKRQKCLVRLFVCKVMFENSDILDTANRIYKTVSCITYYQRM